MKQKVVVIGHGYTSRLGVIRALGRVGYEVVVIVMTTYKKDGSLNTEKPIDCYSKYVSKVYYCPSDRETLIKLLLEKCIDQDQKVVLFTDSDFSEAAVDLNQERLKAHFLFPHINHEQGAVVAWMDKFKQKTVAREVGLNVADGWVIDVRGGTYTIPSEVRYPCFPKPLATLKGGKRGLRRCNNEQELREVIAVLSKTNPTISILVEEFKKIDVEQALLGFTDGKNVIIPGIIKTKLLAHGGHFGVAVQGEIQPVTGYEESVEKFKAFVLKTGFVGIFDIDFYQSEGKYYFCEMNFRYGGSGYAYTAMGVNLPAMMVKTLLGESASEIQKSIGQKAVFVNERMCRDDWAEGYISSIKYYRLLRSANIFFVRDMNDPAPEKEYNKSLYRVMTNIKRLAKLLLRSIK